MKRRREKSESYIKLGEPIAKKRWKKVKHYDEQLHGRIHADRCEKDPIYQLLFFPNEKLEQIDPATGQVIGETTMINKIVTSCIQHLRKTYGPELEETDKVRRAFELLQSKVANVKSKVYALCFFMKREQSVMDKIAQLYDPQNDDGINRFRIMMKTLDIFVEDTLNFPYSQTNIKSIVDNFTQGVMLHYMMFADYKK